MPENCPINESLYAFLKGPSRGRAQHIGRGTLRSANRPMVLVYQFVTEASRPTDLRKFVQSLQELLTALDRMGAAGWKYTDFKVENIVWNADVAVLVDFEDVVYSDPSEALKAHTEGISGLIKSELPRSTDTELRGRLCAILEDRSIESPNSLWTRLDAAIRANSLSSPLGSSNPTSKQFLLVVGMLAMFGSIAFLISRPPSIDEPHADAALAPVERDVPTAEQDVSPSQFHNLSNGFCLPRTCSSAPVDRLQINGGSGRFESLCADGSRLPSLEELKSSNVWVDCRGETKREVVGSGDQAVDQDGQETSVLTRPGRIQYQFRCVSRCPE